MNRPQIPVTVRIVRWAALAIWAISLTVQLTRFGIPLDRTGLVAWIALGLAAASIGRRAVWTVALDWLPFAAVLVAYDYLRGAADQLGMPVWWTQPLDVDRFLFAGTTPTVWLQERLRYPRPQWWDVVASLVYVSFFLAPYVLAGVFWLRSRREFRRWAYRFVTLSFLGFALFALIPSAPPWAAASCTPAEVAHHPADPACLHTGTYGVPNGGLLGMTVHGHDHRQYVTRLSGRGWSYLHLESARTLLDEGQHAVDLVAAVPSLHAGGTLLLVLFVWPRARRWWWRVPLALYPPVMAWALVYTAEHYVSDVLAGWLCAIVVHAGYSGWERRAETRRGRVDILKAHLTDSQPDGAKPCPQAVPTATTPSSISASAAGSSSPPPTSTAAAGPPGTTAPSASS